MRIVFFGTPDPAVPSLRAFLDDPGTEVVAVVTNPDRPRGRGHQLASPPVKVAAQAAGVPVWQPAKARDIADNLRAANVDAGAVVAYGAILPPVVLEAAGRGLVNLHFSLLPAWRGAAPVAASLLHGDRDTGVTCFILEEGMDTGPVLLQARTPIGEDETAGELTARLAEMGAPLLVEAVRGFVDETLRPTAQYHARATLAPKITPEQARLDFRADAASLARAVRAFNPAPGAYTTLDGQRLKVHRARRVDGDGEPAAVLRLDVGGPVVACGRDALELLEVQPAGKARMDGIAFANGYRPVGRRLGR